MQLNKKEVTVTFETNGGTEVAPIVIDSNNKSAIPVAPSKEGYTFVGWYLDPDFNESAEEILSRNIIFDIKVYAKWEKKTYTVNFLASDATLVNGEIQQTIEHGSATIAPIYTKAGHTLSWDKPFSNIISDTTITAVWTIKTYTVTFRNWDNTVIKTETVAYGGAATAPNQNPTRVSDGQHFYIFSSWNKDFSNIIENTEIIAQYNETENGFVTVTFSCNGTYISGELTQIIASGGSVNAPVFTKENYTLSWSRSLDNITSDTVIYGIWNHIEGTLTDLESIWETKESIFSEIWGDLLNYVIIEDNFHDRGIKALTDGGDFFAIEFENQIEVEEFIYDYNNYSVVQIPDTYILCLENFSIKTIFTKNVVNSDYAYYDEDYKTLIRHFGDGEITILNSVTRIGESAFYQNNNVTKVNLSQGLLKIGRRAFQECEFLNTINIPESVTEIGEAAFFNCVPLGSISLPTGIKRIEINTFYNCSSLTTITIPDSVEFIDRSAFSSCTNLAAITIENSQINIEDFAFYDTAWYNALPDGPKYINDVFYQYKGNLNGTFTINEGTKGIAGGAFYLKEVTTVNIPEGVEFIGSRAFDFCGKLTTINLPTSIKSIGSSAFRECRSLTNIVIPYGISTIEKETFSICAALTSITIPDTVTDIKEGAFRDCVSLTQITLPNNLLTIGGDTFLGCKMLENITVPDSVVKIGRQAFSDCIALTSVTLSSSLRKIENGLFSWTRDLTSLSIPDSVTRINNSAFFNSNITQIFIPSSVKIIEPYAFNFSKFLTTITVDENNPYLKSIDGNLYSKDGTILVSYAIGKPDTSFVIPESVQTIETNAFYNATNLTSIILPSNLKRINRAAFYNCSNLESIIINEGVETIEDDVFSSCTSLASITFPSTLTHLGSRIFNDCQSLTSIDLSKTKITTLEKNSFEILNSLQSLFLPSTLTTIKYSVINMCPELVSLIIPVSVTEMAEFAIGYCEKLIIYVQTNSKPSAWHDNWNSFNCPVVFSSIFSLDNTYVTNVYKTVNTPPDIFQAPYRQGYTFEGWYTSADCSGTRYFDLASAPISYLYAKWVINP